MIISNFEIDPATISHDEGEGLVTAKTLTGRIVYLMSFNPMVWVDEKCKKIEGMTTRWMIEQLKVTYALASAPAVL